MKTSPHVVLVPDCGPLLELHRRRQLHWLSLQFASLAVPDAVVHQLVRFHGEAGKAIAIWISRSHIPVLQTRTFNNGQIRQDEAQPSFDGTWVDLCLVEAMKDISTQEGKTRGLLLLDEYKCLEGSPFNDIQFCTPITLGALGQFLPPATVSQEPAVEQGPASPLPAEKQPVFRLNALQMVNPQVLEKHLRKLAGQTAQLCLRGVEVVKTRKDSLKPPASTGPGVDLAEQFRRKLDLKKTEE